MRYAIAMQLQWFSSTNISQQTTSITATTVPTTIPTIITDTELQRFQRFGITPHELQPLLSYAFAEL